MSELAGLVEPGQHAKRVMLADDGALLAAQHGAGDDVGLVPEAPAAQRSAQHVVQLLAGDAETGRAVVLDLRVVGADGGKADVGLGACERPELLL